MADAPAPDGLTEGMAGSVTLAVTADDTAIALGSGDVPVLGTPRVVALVEEASVAAVASALAPGTTTVGTRVELDHRRPTQVGGTVTAAATLEVVDGRALEFAVVVREGDLEVAGGRHRRVVVEREAFGG